MEKSTAPSVRLARGLHLASFEPERCLALPLDVFFSPPSSLICGVISIQCVARARGSRFWQLPREVCKWNLAEAGLLSCIVSASTTCAAGGGLHLGTDCALPEVIYASLSQSVQRHTRLISPGLALGFQYSHLTHSQCWFLFFCCLDKPHHSQVWDHWLILVLREFQVFKILCEHTKVDCLKDC